LQAQRSGRFVNLHDAPFLSAAARYSLAIAMIDADGSM
jgi:hypothetical protein